MSDQRDERTKDIDSLATDNTGIKRLAWGIAAAGATGIAALAGIMAFAVTSPVAAPYLGGIAFVFGVAALYSLNKAIFYNSALN